MKALLPHKFAVGLSLRHLYIGAAVTTEDVVGICPCGCGRVRADGVASVLEVCPVPFVLIRVPLFVRWEVRVEA